MTETSEKKDKFWENCRVEDLPKSGFASKPRIDASIEAELGRRLVDAYSELLNEPVPDRFTKLLEQLVKNDKRK